MELRVGNKYRLGRKIGSGSFGDIYLGIKTASTAARSSSAPSSITRCYLLFLLLFLLLLLHSLPLSERPLHRLPSLLFPLSPALLFILRKLYTADFVYSTHGSVKTARVNSYVRARYIFRFPFFLLNVPSFFLCSCVFSSPSPSPSPSPSHIPNLPLFILYQEYMYKYAFYLNLFFVRQVLIFLRVKRLLLS
jgi:hypothetical protein